MQGNNAALVLIADQGAQVPIGHLLGLLWKSTAAMPPEVSAELGLPPTSTYAMGVGAVLVRHPEFFGP